jgi:hypothetical protein
MSRLAAALALAVGLLPAPARALDLGLRIEPAAAMPLSEPQSLLFGLGAGGWVKGGLGLLPALDLVVGVGYLAIPAGSTAPDRTGSSAPGTAFTLGAGARLHWPHTRGNLAPWLDADALYVRTGALDRFGVGATAGVSFPLGKARRLWFGPFLRYLVIVAANTPGRDDGSAHLVALGFELEIALRPPARAPAPPARDRDGDGVREPDDLCPDEPEDRDGWKDDDGCPDPDNDGDGIPDAQDRCPNAAGPNESGGCPPPPAGGAT